MKKRIALLSIMALLLAGCGGETAKEIQVETAAPATVVTEPTQPPTLLEELGIELWEGVEPIANRISADGGMPYETTQWYTEDFGTYFYAMADEHAEELSASEVVGAEMQVIIDKFMSYNTGEWEYPYYLDSIYDQYSYRAEEPLGKEEWLAKYDGYKVLCLNMNQNVPAAAEKAGGAGTYGYYNYLLGVADAKTGEMLIPTYKNNCHVGRLVAERETGNVEILVLNMFDIWPDQMDTICNTVYAMVPEDFEDLIFVYAEQLEPFTAEEIQSLLEARENEKAGEEVWVTTNLADIQKNEKVRLIYMNHIPS